MLDTSKLNQTIWAIASPNDWAKRYSNRVTLATPLFIEFDESDKDAPKARLIDINGGVDPDWSPLIRFQESEAAIATGAADECFLRIGEDVLEHLKRCLADGNPADAACILMAGMARESDDWAELIDELEEDRYEANAWFERDNKQLTLLDQLSGKYVVDLSGDDVDSAIESGYLSIPRHPRPSDSDWHNPLLEYARSQGAALSPQDLLQSRLSQTRKQAPREQ